MIKILLFAGFLHFVNPTIEYAPNRSVSFSPAYQQSEPERLMGLFLKAIQSNDDNEVKKFISDNYSKRFLEIPVNVHQNIIRKLHKDFVHHTVTQTVKNDNKITVTIKSPVNKSKQITVETDKGSPAKISMVDIKD